MAHFSKYLLSVILFLSVCISANSQNSAVKAAQGSGFAGRWFAGVTAGPDFYFGDIRQPSGAFGNNISFSGGIFGGRQLTNVFGIRGQILAGGIRGQRSVVQGDGNESFSFSGSFFELNANATINFSNMVSPYKTSRKFFIYGTVGVGMTSWGTQLTDLTDPENPVVTPAGWRMGAVIPVGLGAFYSVTPRLNLGLEYTIRTVTSDLMDQYKANYKFDVYDYLAVGISFNFGKPKAQPQVVRDYPYQVIPRSEPQPPVVTEPIRLPAPAPQTIDDYVYVVQIFAFAKHDYSAETIRNRYHIVQPVKKVTTNGVNRYTVGNYRSLEYARELREEMIKKGIPDAFIIALKDGEVHHIIPRD
jgi:hypothetical protein